MLNVTGKINLMNFLKLLPCLAVLFATSAVAQWDLNSLYEAQVFDGMPCRVIRPLDFDSTLKYPMIVSRHGAGRRGTENNKQLKDWSRQLAEHHRRKKFLCCVVAQQAKTLREQLPTESSSDPSLASSERSPLQSGDYFITQSWSQERNFRRTYYVNVPEASDAEKLPVFIFLHGNGGTAARAMNGFTRRNPRLAARYITVFPQGYLKSWNIVSERSKADDRGFIEAIIRKLAAFDNVQSNNFTVMGSSNGAALVNQMAIETRLPNIRNYITGVSPLNVWQHDGKHFKAKGADNNYREAATPMMAKRLMNISGTEDRLVPYKGGPSPAIPAKDGKLAFVHAERSTFLWAKAMGYQGTQLSEPTRTDGNLSVFSYLDGDVIHYQVSGVGHGATNAINEATLLQFLEDKE